MGSVNNHVFLLSTSTNCTTIYNESTRINNIPVTYITNYAMVATGIISALAVWFLSAGNCEDVWVALFFVFFAIGNVIVSTSAHFISDDESLSNYLILVISHLFITISYSALLFTGIKSMTPNNFVRDIWLVSTVLIMVLTAIRLFFALFAWGVIVGIVIICLSIKQALDDNKLYFLKALGVLIYIIAGFIQIWLLRVCGKSAMETCFDQCPLKNPESFNHDALYHILTTIGIIFHAIGEAITPSSRVGPRNDDDNDTSTLNGTKRSIPRVIQHDDDVEVQCDDLTQEDFEGFEEDYGYSSRERKV